MADDAASETRRTGTISNKKESTIKRKPKEQKPADIAYVGSGVYEPSTPTPDIPDIVQVYETLDSREQFIFDAKTKARERGDRSASIFPGPGYDNEFRAEFAKYVLSLTRTDSPDLINIDLFDSANPEVSGTLGDEL